MSQQLLLEIIPASDPTFDNMVVGSNAAAIDAARGLAPGRALYLWGPPGSGRSHFLRALACSAPSIYLNTSSTAVEMMDWATAQEIKVDSAPVACPTASSLARLIVIDDIQDMDEAQQASVFALYNRWRECASTDTAFGLAVSGNLAPMMMPLREDLRTRLGWDLVFRIEPLSDEDKSAALQAYAHAQGLPLSAEVLDWMLTHYSRDIRQLFALVDALDRYSLSKHRTVTVPLLRTMLADRDFLQSI